MAKNHSSSHVHSTYDETPYDSFPFKQSQPDRLFSIGRLFGMHPTPPSTSRILELGCAAGGNIIPLAFSYPHAQIVGVDLSKVQIDTGNAQIKELKLNNITLHHASIMDIGRDYGEFDYIIAHGIFSWVPEDVRQKMLDLCGDLLTPQGIAYISYNALPGWNMIKSVRDMMMYHSTHFDATNEKINQAKALVSFVQDALKDTNTPHAQIVKNHMNRINTSSNCYIRHDYLEEDNQAYYLHEFVKEGRKRGLQYLADATLTSMYTGNMPSHIQKALSATNDIVRTEQYMDFITNSQFKCTLLCRDMVLLNRAVDVHKIEEFYIESYLDCEKKLGPLTNLMDDREENTFYRKGHQDINLKTSSPGLKAILYTLSEHPHHCLSIDEIVDLSHQKIPDIAPQYIRIEFLKHSLTLLFSGFLMISSEKPINTPSKDSSKPKVYPVARAQAKKMKTNRVSNLKNQIVVISALEQLVFPYMTGHYTKEQIADRLVHNHAPSGKGLYLSDDDAPITDPMLIRSAVIEAMGSLINSALEKSLLME